MKFTDSPAVPVPDTAPTSPNPTTTTTPPQAPTIGEITTTNGEVLPSCPAHRSYKPGMINVEAQALLLASYGLPVYPLHTCPEVLDDEGGWPAPGQCSCGKEDCSAGKHPKTQHGRNDASTNPAVIKQWNWASSNIGVALGGSIFALDVDNHTHCKDGMSSLSKLQQQYGLLPPTWTVSTQSGGRHIYFRVPAGKVLRTTTKAMQSAGYDGVEVHHDGSSTVAPPSIGPLGEYSWLPGCAPWDLPIADAPEWLLTIAATDELQPAGNVATKRSVTPVTKGVDGYLRRADGKVDVISTYNNLVDPCIVLERNGYGRVQGGRYHRPGGKNGTVAILPPDDNHPWKTSYHHSSNDPLCDDHCHSSFDLLCKLEHNSDVKEAVKVAAREIGIDEHEGKNDTTDLPAVVLPGGSVRITDSASELGNLLAKTGKLFYRGGELLRANTQADGYIHLDPIKSAQWPTLFEKVASLKKWVKGKEQAELRDTVCSIDAASAIVNAEDFIAAFPVIKVVTRCPVIVEKDGRLDVIAGYDADTGILAAGQLPPEVTLADAVTLLSSVLDDFQFATPSDRSRAIAALITPALVFGGLLPGRAPVDLGEADESQAGKGVRNLITTAIYNDLPDSCSQPEQRGVGSLQEKFDAALLRVSPFIEFDNIRGVVNMPALESFCTQATYTARVAYRPPIQIDPSRIVVMMTSNNARMEGPDLPNRCSIVRIRKQVEGYKFKEYPEGSIVQHIRANQSTYLGAVFAVIKVWHAAGKPIPQGIPHARWEWAGIMNWLVTQVFHEAPLMEGHQDAQRRAASPDLAWMRLVALAVIQEGQHTQWLKTANIVNTLACHRTVDVPGLEDGGDLDRDDIFGQCCKQTGKRLSRCFGVNKQIVLDDITVTRQTVSDRIKGRDISEYCFMRTTPVGKLTDPLNHTASIAAIAYPKP